MFVMVVRCASVGKLRKMSPFCLTLMLDGVIFFWLGYFGSRFLILVLSSRMCGLINCASAWVAGRVNAIR